MSKKLLDTTNIKRIAAVAIGIIIMMATNNAIAYAQQQTMATEHDSVTALIDNKVIPSKGFIHIYDSTPSLIASGHIAAHLPCDDNGQAVVQMVGGVAPDVVPIDMELVDKLSIIGKVCMYHADIPQNKTDITDIAVLNPTDQDITLPDTSSVVIHVSRFEETMQASESTEHH